MYVIFNIIRFIYARRLLLCSTGGGPAPAPLSDVDVLVEDVVGKHSTTITGIAGGVDSGYDNE